MYPGSVTSKKTIEWGYFSDDDDDWKVVDKSSMKDEVEDLEKNVGFVGKLCFFLCTLDSGLNLSCIIMFIHYYFSSSHAIIESDSYEFFVQTGTADSATGYYCHYDDGRLRVGEETSYDINAQMKPKK